MLKNLPPGCSTWRILGQIPQNLLYATNENRSEIAFTLLCSFILDVVAAGTASVFIENKLRRLEKKRKGYETVIHRKYLHSAQPHREYHVSNPIRMGNLSEIPQ